MNIILLSGGSGKRLWPLSNDIRSKQFIKIFKNDGDDHESMLQRVYRQIHSVDPNTSVTIASAKSQVPTIRNQLRTDVGICAEPFRRDTFPAIVLSCAFLRDVRQVDPNETVVICPVDPYVTEDYFRALQKLETLVAESRTNLALLGITPTHPSEKYGYIIPESNDTVTRVRTFREKPDLPTAKQYIDQGALWNGGVFACRISYVLELARKRIGYDSYDALLENYENLERISFDYAVVEKEPDIQVLRFNGLWNDLGTWNSLTEALDENCVGRAVLSDTCRNVHVINKIGVPILAMGLENAVIAASPQGILVSDKNQADSIKPYVDGLQHQIMFAEKSWGSFRVVDLEEDSLVIKVTLNAGNKMNYHSHTLRDETWIVNSGTGYTIIDGVKRDIRPGDVISLPAGCRHTVVALTKLRLTEVQLGKHISASDKQKYDLPDTF